MVLCVTGNGRSGTSLVASFLDRAGIAMGIEMRGPGKGCRFGFYEDTGFLEFQKAVLKRNRSGLYFPWKPVEINDTERRQAASLIAERNEKWQQWGWKDPRSTLFLPFWGEILPQAKFLIMYRNPEEVVTSVYRQMHRYYRYFRPDLAPRSWLHYNRMALGFYREHPGRVAFLDVGDLKRQPERTINALSHFLGVAIDPAAFHDVYRSQEMSAHNIKIYKEPFISTCLRISIKLMGDDMAALFTELNSASVLNYSQERSMDHGDMGEAKD